MDWLPHFPPSGKDWNILHQYCLIFTTIILFDEGNALLKVNITAMV